MNNKILLTIMIIVALLIAIYKWILSDDTENEETVQETTTEKVKEPASEKEENVKGQAEEAKTEDKVETIHKKVNNTLARLEQDTGITQNMFRSGIDYVLQKGYGRTILCP